MADEETRGTSGRPVFVERTFLVEGSPRIRTIRAILFAPTAEPGGSHACRWEIHVDGLPGPQRAAAVGVDSWQACFLAFLIVSQEVEALLDRSGGQVDSAFLREVSVFAAVLQGRSVDAAIARVTGEP